MSYNTRRQGGVGRGTSQVMYHQQQSPGSRPAGPVRTGASPQNTQGYSSGYSSLPAGYQSGGNPGYNTQQYQAQQQVVPPPPPPPMSVQQSPVSKPLHGILKTESSSPSTLPQPPQPPQQQPPQPPQPPLKVDQPGAGDISNNVDEEIDESGQVDVKPRPAWMKKKLPGQKVNKTVMRRRQNAKLRRLLQPKNAIMVLHELVTGVTFTVQEHVNALSQTTYEVNLEIDGVIYTGQAMSKNMAKQIAAENALKAVLINRITKASVLYKGNNDSSVGSVSEEGSEKSMVVEDDTPWKSITSFAIYKLFQEWQNEGVDLPNVGLLASGSAAQPLEINPQKPMRKIPDNPTDRHPVMLLYHMRPRCEIVEVCRTGNPPDLTFTMQTTLDGKSYTGIGRNKKEAKKEVAKAALADLFDIHYE